MSWTDAQYDYKVGGISLLLYCERVRVVIEGMAARRGQNFSIPGLEGEFSYPGKLREAMNVAIEVTLRYTDENGLITHTDGASGHVFENLAEVKRLFAASNPAVIQRTLPHQGTVMLDFEILAEPVLGGSHFQYVFLCHAPGVYWRSTTAESYTGGTGNIPVGGNAPVHDAILTFSTDGSIMTDDGLSGVEIAGLTSAVTVDCGRRTVIQSAVPAPGLILPLSNRWLYLSPDPTDPANPVPVTIVGTVEVEWFPKWL